MFSKININKSKQGNPIASDPLRLNSVNQQQLKEKTLILLKSLKLLKPIITVKWETNQRKLIERERERERERESTLREITNEQQIGPLPAWFKLQNWMRVSLTRNGWVAVWVSLVLLCSGSEGDKSLSIWLVWGISVNLGIYFYKKLIEIGSAHVIFLFFFWRAKNGLQIYILVIVGFHFVVGWNTGGTKKNFLVLDSKISCKHIW